MTLMKKLVVLTGAGISAESGIRTFRDADGLWEGFDVMEVATPQGWAKNRSLVLDFYNQRRKQAMAAEPNEGHRTLANLEKHFDVTIITQNVDNLHEKAGSSQVIHLHGELFKVRSTIDENLVYDLKGLELKEGDLCEKGSQLRPHIVWFGELVPLIETAATICTKADIFMVVGTSLMVYPAASLINYVRPGIHIYVVDPHLPDLRPQPNLTMIQAKAGEALPSLAKRLIVQHEC